jgi:small subunit ribosomal protein S20
MNKKQKNRKIVNQNKRNRIINRRYTSTIKSLSKLLKIKLKKYNETTDILIQPSLKAEISYLVRPLTSILDKAVKKKIIHKNCAARKKALISQLLEKI